MRFFIYISFRGADYCGWQIQDNGPTIEAEIERALSICLSSPINVVGAGRTDTGVNASCFYAHFDTENTYVIDRTSEMLHKLNAILPLAITVHDIYPVSDSAHARFDAFSRTYQYHIHFKKDPFGTDFSYWFHHEIDIARMNRAAGYLIGEKDFSCFEKLRGNSSSPICTVSEAEWTPHNDPYSAFTTDSGYIFTITANRFLRNMVRAIVGSLLEIGRGRKDPEWICELLESGNRSAAGQSVPGNALFLTDIKYPYELISLNNK